jgi:hypothetical protein
MIAVAFVQRHIDYNTVTCPILNYEKDHFAFDSALKKIDLLVEEYNKDYFEDDPYYITAVAWNWH